MKRIVSAIAALIIAASAFAQGVYDFSVKGMDGKSVSLSQYKGKVLLVVNTATKCGFTPQYKELQEIYDEFSAKGFEVLDFPCNQFGSQAPGSIDEIHEFCTGKYETTFPQFDKIDVNGAGADPLFVFLKGQQPYKNRGGKMKMIEKISKSVEAPDDVRWNFTKFLVDKDGKVIARFEPVDDMALVRAAVGNALK